MSNRLQEDLEINDAMGTNDPIILAKALIKKGEKNRELAMTSGQLYAFFADVFSELGPSFNLINIIDSIGTPDSLLFDGIREDSHTQGNCCDVMSTIVVPSNIKTIDKNARIVSTNVTHVIFDTEAAIPIDFLSKCNLLQHVTFKRLPAKISDITGRDLAEKNNIKFDFNNNTFDSSHVISRAPWNYMKKNAVNIPDASKKAIEKRLNDLAAYHQQQIDKYLNEHQ